MVIAFVSSSDSISAPERMIGSGVRVCSVVRGDLIHFSGCKDNLIILIYLKVCLCVSSEAFSAAVNMVRQIIVKPSDDPDCLS